MKKINKISNLSTKKVILAVSIIGFSAVGGILLNLSKAEVFQPTAPYYATFFYPWSHNPNTDTDWSYWSDNGHNPPSNWFSNYLPDVDPNIFDPATELYSSNDDSIIYWQLEKMKEAKMEVAISSWWGQGHKTDQTFGRIVSDVMNRPDNPYPNLRWALYYEKEGFGNPSVSEIVSDLNHINTNYRNESSMLKINGKPVMFVYGDATDAAEMATRWSQVRQQTDFYVVLKVYPGFESDPNQPDSWHQYAPAVRSDDQSPYSYMVSPGFWKDGEPERLNRDLNSFRSAVSQMVSSNAQWKLIQTWNEWGEGTSVEPGTQVIQTTSGSASIDPNGYEFGNTYIDALNQLLPELETGTTPPPPPPDTGSSFTFAALGDVGENSRADATLAGIANDSTDFTLMLGDLDYDESPSDEAWCDYVKGFLGNDYPFQIIAGNHEEQGGPDGYIMNHAGCLPNKMSNMVGDYPQQYYFDYPQSNPILRAIMISADLTVENVHYDYSIGNQYYNWLANAIDEAKNQGRWVVVGTHKNCITTGTKPCEIGEDLMDLLIEKRVDLVLQGHEHNYQRSKQLICANAGTYDPACVADSDNSLERGAGTVFIINGMGGRCCYDVNPNDSEAGYFATFVGEDAVNRSGYVRFNVSSDQIDSRFVSTVGTLDDLFSIGGTPPDADVTPPSVAIANPSEGTTVNGTLLVQANANDDIGVKDVKFYIDGEMVFSDGQSPYEYNWNSVTVPDGPHQIYAVASDDYGNSTQSSTVNVTTDNGVSTYITRVYAIEDTYAYSANPDANYGFNENIQVDSDPDIKTAFLKYDLRNISGTINSAKLRMYITNNSGTDQEFRSILNDSWDESNLTYNNMPTLGSVVANLDGGPLNTWVEVDLTSYVNSKKGQIMSLGVSATGSDGLYIASKESANQTELLLEIDSSGTYNKADINTDGTVDIVDLSILLSAWGSANQQSDISSDGTVDIVDLSMLLSAWGS